MSKKLYIVGNGFDMHHCLKTSYWHFGQYLLEHNEELYVLLNRYISYANDDKDLWSNFEANLANLEIYELLESASNYLPNYGSDDFRDRDRYDFNIEMEKHYEMITHSLLAEFKDFINAVEITDQALEHKIAINKQARFLTFNYTPTLEKLYNIEPSRVTYIHNAASQDEHPLILGHGIDPKVLAKKKPVPPSGLSEEDLERWIEDQADMYDYSYDLGEQTIREYFRVSFKPTIEIIGRFGDYWQDLSDITEIEILGHSMSAVDIQYFIKVVESVNTECTWKVSFHDQGDDVKFKGVLTGLGVDPDLVSTFRMSDLNLANLQLMLQL